MKSLEETVFANAGVILTHSGLPFDLLNPDPGAVEIGDVAHALSNLCRFCGHVRSFYSVAQHSVLVSHLVPIEDALAGLLHDAAEAYLSDLVRPLKQLLPEYRRIEEKVEEAVYQAFGLPERLPESVKTADLQALALEKHHLMPESDPWPILEGIEIRELRSPGECWWNNGSDALHPLLPGEAKQVFLDRYRELTGEPEPNPRIAA